MRVARRSFLASTAAVLAAPAFLRLASADGPQVALKLHHFFSSVSSGHDKFMSPWARKIEAESGGRIRIDIFPSMQLGGAPAQLFDQVSDGTADIVWLAPSLTPGRFPKIETFELPFVPSRRALVSSKAVEDFAAANLQDEFNDVHPICFSCTDRGVIHANQPIRILEDIKGLSMHVQTRLAGEAMRVLGARPVPMPMAQLPLAVTQRVVDGCLDPWHVVPTLRLNDVLRTHTEFAESSLSTTTFVLAMNKAAYDHLPRELKTVIDSNSGQIAAGMAGAMWDLQAAAVSDMVVQRGDPIVTLLPEAVAHWRRAVEPVLEAWVRDMKEHKVDGSKLIASARAALAKFAKEPEPQPAQMPPQQETAARPEPHATEAKAEVTAAPREVTTPPKMDVPAPRPSAPKPAPTMSTQPAMQPPAAASRMAAPTPAPAPHPQAAVPGPSPVPVQPAAAPAPAPIPPAAVAPAGPSIQPVAPPAPPVQAVTPSAPAPVATVAPPPAPPVPKPVPKALDIPL